MLLKIDDSITVKYVVKYAEEQLSSGTSATLQFSWYMRINVESKIANYIRKRCEQLSVCHRSTVNIAIMKNTEEF